MPAPRSKNVELLSRPTPSTVTARDKMEHRQTVAGGSSPFYGDEPRPAPIDRTKIVVCPVENCRRHFLNETFLAKHIESRHQPKPKTADAAATELVRATIADRIESGELKPGQPLIQAKLIEQLGTTRHHVQSAVEQLIAADVLGYSGVGVTRRVIVVGG